MKRKHFNNENKNKIKRELHRLTDLGELKNRIRRRYPRAFRYIKKSLIKREIINIIKQNYNVKVKYFEGTIYVIGDSHSNFFSGEEYINFIPLENNINIGNNLIPFFNTFHLGPALAFNLSKYNSETKALEKIQYLINNIIPPRAILLLCFGEIDCRVHILKQAQKQGKSFEEIIDDILDNYFNLVKLLKKRGFRIICWGPIPSQKDNWFINPELPAFGDEKSRNKVTQIFNLKLKEKCCKNNAYFCSIFKYLISQDYQTKSEYISDQCHLSQKAMSLAIKELIDNKIIILNNLKNIAIVNPGL